MIDNKDNFTAQQLVMLPNGKWEGENPIKRLSVEQVSTLKDGMFKQVLREGHGQFLMPKESFQDEGISYKLLNKITDSKAIQAAEKSAFKAGIPTPPIYLALTSGGRSPYDISSSRFIIFGSGCISLTSASLEMSADKIEDSISHEIGHGFQKELSDKRDISLAFMGVSGLVATGSFLVGAVSIFKGDMSLTMFCSTSLLASTGLTSSLLIGAKNAQHQQEFDADEYAIRHSDNPEKCVSNILAGSNNKKPKITNLKDALKLFWKKNPIREGYLNRNSHPYDEDRVSHGKRVIEQIKSDGQRGL